MDASDAREALKWDFDKYFPFPYADATFDLGPINTLGEGARESARYVVAASRLHVVNSLPVSYTHLDVYKRQTYIAVIPNSR